MKPSTGAALVVGGIAVGAILLWTFGAKASSKSAYDPSTAPTSPPPATKGPPPAAINRNRDPFTTSSDGLLEIRSEEKVEQFRNLYYLALQQGPDALLFAKLDTPADLKSTAAFLVATYNDVGYYGGGYVLVKGPTLRFATAAEVPSLASPSGGWALLLRPNEWRAVATALGPEFNLPIPHPPQGT
jgi:hypothetical protein